MRATGDLNCVMAELLDEHTHRANLEKLYDECPLPPYTEYAIRLLHFERWEHEDDDIRCTMQAFTDDLELNYNPISYTWGEPTDLRTITINNLSIKVRDNCWYALWQVRRIHSAHLVWIDSICINQDDVEEKSSQVNVMDEIYRFGTHVFACVGPHENDSEYLIDQIALLVEEQTHRPESGFTSYEWGDSELNLRSRRDVDSRMDDSQFERLKQAALAFGDRVYWTRAWVAQELCLSRMQWVLIGRDSFAWPVLCALLYAVDDSFRSRQHARAVRGEFGGSNWENRLSMKFHGMRSFYNSARSNGNPREFGGVAAHGLLASDPRDRVFALRKLVVWPLMSGEIYPDYSKSRFQIARELLLYWEAQEYVSLDPLDDTLFDFASNLLGLLDISSADSELREFFAAPVENNGCIEAAHSNSRSNHPVGERLIGVPLSLERSWCVSRNGPISASESPRYKKCILGTETKHWTAVVDGRLQRGDVVVTVMKKGMLLVLRYYANFIRIVGSGFIAKALGYCTHGTCCDCYNSVNHIMDTFALETELVMDETDLWRFVSRDWGIIADWKPGHDVPAGLLDNPCRSELSSIAIRRPTMSDLMASGEGSFEHWSLNVRRKTLV